MNAPRARIHAVSYHLPEDKLTNERLSAEFPEWSVEKISSKTGIHERSIAGPDEFSSDLAVAAAERLFEEHGIDRSVVDYIIVCTQTPDFLLPSTSTIVQDRLRLPRSVGATDITLGCSGYVYGLGLAKGLIESGQARNVLLLTADTYTKLLNPADKSVRTIFGDGASATLVTDDADQERLRAFVYGSDGAGARHLIVPQGGLRDGGGIAPKSAPDARGLDASTYDLYMDGPEIFNFTLDVVPATVDQVLERAELTRDDIDLFVFHQANAFMLDHLRKKLAIEPERFFVSLERTGNTVSSTIPIALADAVQQGRLKPGMTVMLLGFGVGLSWAGSIVEW